MPAPISEARLQANRRNAQLSSGPKTAEGKARSRGNAIKHGLTGAGIALPTEDAAAIEARFLTMQEEFAPATMQGALLIHLAAFMSVRIERSARLETAALTHVRRHAATEFELARLAEIDRLFQTIETDPRANHRRLQTTIEGVDLLLDALQGVRDQVELGLYRKWTTADRTKIDCFLGGSESRFPTSRADALLLALQGNYSRIFPRELDKTTEGDPREQYFRDEMILLVDVERARLEQVRGTIDPTVVESDRREAAEHATLPMTPESILHKKYEAAAISTFLRSLREFQKVEKAAAEAESEIEAPAPVSEPEVAALASPSAPSKNEPIAPTKNEPIVSSVGANPHHAPSFPTHYPPRT